MDQPVPMMGSGGANVIQQTKLIQGFQVLALAMSFARWPSGKGRRYSAEACLGLRKPRIEDVCMRVPGGSVLAYSGGPLLTLPVSPPPPLSLSPSCQFSCRLGRRMSEILVFLVVPAFRGAVALRHVSETVDTTHAALSRIDCHQQGTMVQIVERMQTMGDLRALQMQMQMQCACRS